MATLKPTGNYLNPYEALQDRYKGTPLYQELGGDETWKQFAREGRLDNLVTMMQDASDYEGGIGTISQKYGFDYLDKDGKLSAVANELYGDRTNLNKYYEYVSANGDKFYSTDDSLLSQDKYKDYTKTEVEMSDYDYNKYQLDNYVNYKKALEARQMEIDERNDMNGFLKFLASAGATFMEVGQAAIGQLQNVGSLVAASGDSLATLISTGNVGKADEAFREWFKGNTWLEDDLTEFERKYTYFRDIDGNITSVGKYVTSIADSIGMALPTMALSLIPVVGPTAGQIVYWSGMAGANMREFINDPAMASVPTYQMLISSGVKATLQWGVQFALTKGLGATLGDKLVFGYKTAGSAGSGIISKFATDAIHEGVEEVLQEFTDQFTDSVMSLINSSFDEYGKRTMQDYMDAFVLGALGSIVMGGMELTFTRGELSNVPKTDKDGNILYDKKGNIKYRRIGKLDSINLREGLQTLTKNYSRISELIANGKLNNRQARQLTGQMAVAFRSISSVYGAMGDTRFTAANNLLQQIELNSDKAHMTAEQYNKIATQILKDYGIVEVEYRSADPTETVNKYKTDRQRRKEERRVAKQKEAAKKIADAKITQVDKVVTRDDITSEITADSKQKFENEVLDKIFNANPDVKKIVVSKDGEKPVQVDDTLIVSNKMIAGLGDKGIQKSLSEQRLVENVAAMKIYNQAFKQLRDIWNKLKPKNPITTDEDIVYQVFFNDTFFKIALQTATVDTSRFLTALSDVEQSATSKTSVDAQYKQRIANVLKNRFKLYIEYYINQQQDMSYKSNPLFDNKTKKLIEEKRYSKDLYNRVVNGEKLSQDDLIVIGERINYLPIKSEAKEKLRKNIFSTEKNSRIAGMNALSQAYRDVYTSPYDGRRYLKNDTLGNVTWNTWAQQLGINIRTLMAPVDEQTSATIVEQYGEVTPENILKFYQDQFLKFSENTYAFNYNNGKVTVYEYSSFKSPAETVAYRSIPESSYNRGYVGDTQTFVLANKVPKGVTEQFVKADIEYRDLVTIDNIVRDTSLLDAKSKQAIIDKYGRLNSRNTFLYLRTELNKKGYTISIDKNGKFILTEVKKALTILKDTKNLWKRQVKDKYVPIDLDKTYSVQEFVKPAYRDEGFLKNTQVRFTTEAEAKKGIGNYYSPEENLIVLDRNGINNVDYMNAAFLHEYQHAVQYANNWNGGISARWITDYSVTRDTLDRMLKDAEEHVPSIFQGVTKRDVKLAVLEKFVYETSGETQALGIENNTEYNVVYPTIVNMTQQESYIVMPWGKKYKIRRVGYDIKNAYSLRKGSGIIEFVKDVLDPEKYWREFFHKSQIFNAKNKSMLTQNDVLVYTSDTNQAFVYAQAAKNREPIQTAVLREHTTKMMTPETRYTAAMLLHNRLAPNIPFKDFYNMDIPFTRIQIGNSFMYNSDGVSISAGDNSFNFLRNLSYFQAQPYLIVGTFKPKDISNYIGIEGYNECIIEPSKLKNLKGFAVEVNPNKDITILSEYKVEVTGEVKKYLTQNVSQTNGSIQVNETYPYVHPVVRKAFENTYSVRNLIIPGNITARDIARTNAVFTPIGNYTSQEEYGVGLLGYTNRVIYDKSDAEAYGNYYETFSNCITSVSFDDGRLRVIFAPYIAEETFNNLVEYIQAKIDHMQVEQIILEGRYNKFTRIITPDSNIKYELYSYIDNVNGWVRDNATSDFLDGIAQIQPSDYATPYEQGKGIFNLYNREDIAKFEQNVSTLQERINNEDAIKYQNIALENKNSLNGISASKRWLQEVLNLTAEDYIPVMIFYNTNGRLAAGYQYAYFIPLVEHPTYTMLLGDTDYVMQTGVVKIGDIDEVDVNVNGDFIRFNSEKITNVNTPQDIRLSQDRTSFTITNAESEFTFNKQSFAKPRKSVSFTERRKNKANLTGEERNKARYVSNKDAQGTNLKYFIKKNVPIQMDPAMQDLIVNLDLEQTDKDLRDMIDGKRKGTLNKQRLFEYIRTTKSMNDYTFKMINKYIFQNPAIKNFKQLRAYADISPADYFALRTVLQVFNKESYLEKKLNYAQVRQIIDELKKRDDWKALYEKIYNMYNMYRGAYSVDVDNANLRILFMKYFDGTIQSGAEVASLARWLAVHNYQTPGHIYTTSLDKSIGEDITVADTIADKSSSEFISSIGGYVTETEMMDTILDYRYGKLYADEHYLELTPEELKARQDKIAEEVDQMTSDEIVKEYTAIQVASEDFTDDYFKAVDEAVSKEIRPRKNILTNTKRMANVTIAQNLSAKALQRFKKANPDFFDENNKLNPKLYTGVSYSKLVELENRVRELSKSVRQGLFNSTTNEAYLRKISTLAKKVTNLSKQNEKLKEQIWKYENTETKSFSDDVEFVINSNIPMPEKLSTMIGEAFTKGAEKLSSSKVKFVTEENVDNAKISMTEFIKLNYSILDSLAQGEVDDIIDYYANSMVVDNSLLSRNNYRAYQSYEIIVLSYFLEMQRSNVIQLSDEQVKTINNILNTIVSNAATLMGGWKKAMKYANPTKIIVQSLRQSSGLEITEDDVNTLTAALNLSIGDVIKREQPDGSTISIEVTNKYKIDAISKAMQDVQQHILEQYKQKQKSLSRTEVILNKLTDFRRLMMLSGPGTAIRNLTSNAIVYTSNKVSGTIGTAITNTLAKVSKKFKAASQYEGQWKISGVKVPEYVKTFADGFFEHTVYRVTDAKTGKVKDVSFYDAIADGLTKYDPRKINRPDKENSSFTDLASELMIKKVVSSVYNQHRFDSTADTRFDKLNKFAEKVGVGLNKVNNLVFWLLQDDYWIKKTTKYYFERMLVEQQVPLHQGVSSRTIDLFAEAYTKAAYDYMHKPNVWNKIEQSIHEKMGPAAYFTFKTVFPFASASWNWFVEALNYTPIGLAKGIIQFAKLENTIQKLDDIRRKGDPVYSSKFASYEARKTIGKGIIGSIGMLAGMLLGGLGLAGIDEEDGKLKLKIADVYIDISDLFGSQGILAGLAITSFRYEDTDVVGVLTNVLDSLFAESVFTDLYNSFQYTDSFADWLLNETEDMLTSYVPNFLKTFNSLLYTHQIKYDKGLLGTLEYFGVSLIPGLAYALPKRYDPYTGEVKSKYKLQWLINFINRMGPIDIMPYNISDMEKEAISYGVAKGELTGRYTDIGQLDAEQVSALNKKYGTLNKDDLDNLINNRVKYNVQGEDGTYKNLTYSQMTPTQRKRVIERIMSDNVLYAKIYVYTQLMDGKYFASNNEYNILRSLGIVKNVYRENNKQKGFIVDTKN